ncbi:23S rRNA pseudouridine(955/2504/2580) synthase RluC [Candidatus Erwinia haradaeae]|uniref:Pseudouridine synthase n=1 Tax=Candidatus Erwinia haradaeae TaxID=1922217 RepID=A0A451D7F1_9GAMM|nr:23S rRNA pseudouridine(955/2504/2580) synthase RluC [Candidatus Erwinia haradaeae]VFP81762.1 Ribosomal large subunit pseudouridine synthase C [Candidatus Erwinia haradaeae]
MVHKIQPVSFITISSDMEGQRVDNFLFTQLKVMPKSMIYRILRKGLVRVNKKRIRPKYKLINGDTIRVPRVWSKEVGKGVSSTKVGSAQTFLVENSIIYEDEYIVILNKPAGIAVHGGSGLRFGVIEVLRASRPDEYFLELVHRLDRYTSGLLLVAKKRSSLRDLHEQLREKRVKKYYLALVQGQWPIDITAVSAPLSKHSGKGYQKEVRVCEEGKSSQTLFQVKEYYSKQATLIQARPLTGRMHQIRVHALHAGHPIALDNLYGNSFFNEYVSMLGLKRLFLHASSLCFTHPNTRKIMCIKAPIDQKLENVLITLRMNI